jgi:hypothetical protein
MKQLIAIPAGVNHPYDLFNDYVIRVTTKETDDTFNVIAKCGLALEDHLQNNGMNTLYKDPSRYTLAGIIWKTPTDTFVNKNIPLIQTIRGDELIFPSININYNISWVVGHPRALIKWAAVCIDLNQPNVNPYHRFPKKLDQVCLPWLAHRIGLKVYGQDEINS